jgi:hypothetical protein
VRRSTEVIGRVQLIFSDDEMMLTPEQIHTFLTVSGM